jgi:hypothetical protein
MLDRAAMRAELEKLSSEAIAQICGALHDLKDGVIRDAAHGILWDRHATPGGEWPVSEQEIGNPNDWDSPRGKHRVVAHCSKGKAPWDPLHQVKRMLNWKYQDERGERSLSGLECTCGRRTDLEGRDHRLDLKQRQDEPTARVWPTVMRDSIPHYQVCKYARCADDPDHAPNVMGDRCFCGGYLGMHNTGDKTDKFMPAY